jgi:hypothetical protein
VTDQVATPPVPGTPEYDKAMIALADSVLPVDQREPENRPPESASSAPTKPSESSNPDTSSKPTKPAEVPDKFWDADKGEVRYAEWAKSTREAEQALTRKAQEDKQAQTKKAAEDALAAVKAKEGATPEEIAAAEAALAEASKPLPTDASTPEPKKVTEEVQAKFTEEFNTSGDLTPESRSAAAEAYGVPQEMVDAYVEGQKALREQLRGEVFKLTDGESGYTAMSQWASTNVPKADLEAFNASLAGSVPQAHAAIRDLYSRYKASVGTDPTLVGGGGSTVSNGFRSQQEMVTAMSDPRYSADPAYRKDIEARLAVTTAF